MNICKENDCSLEVYRSRRCYIHFREYTNETMRKWTLKNKERFKIYEKRKKEKLPIRKCIICHKAFKGYSVNGVCSHLCLGELWRRNKDRAGDNNPAYRNGFYSFRKPSKDSITVRHMQACRKFRKGFVKIHGYKFCELCGINNSLRFETHHIVFASEAPRHKELHNNLNLIMLCIKCHNLLHKNKRLRNDLVIQRDLEKLFNKKLIYGDKNKTNECQQSMARQEI